MVQDSSLSSIIPTYLDPWRRLRETEQLARLHAKFWHRSMEAEEREWRKTQLENEPMAVDVDKQPGDDDIEDTEGEDNENDTGCFILQIDIPGREQVWVRKEFIKLYNCCDDYLKSDRQSVKPRSVVITGQPGIGKSYWIFYALRRRLAEGKPVIWYRNSKRFLFVKDGVYEAPKGFESTDLKIRVWTLVDSDQLKGIPPELAVPQTQHLIIFITSPQPKRWKPLEKTTLCGVFIMNPWTRKEILQVAVIHGFEDSDHQRIITMYDQFGPTPRICYYFLENASALIVHRARSQSALRNLSLKALQKMILDARALNLSTVSSMLFVMKRVPEKRLRRANLEVDNVSKYIYASLEPITHAVEVALQNQLWQEEQIDQFKFYSLLASSESTMRLAGLVFKSMGHSRLRKRIELGLFPVAERESRGSGRAQLHSTHGGTSKKPEFSIDIQPTRVITYPGSSLGTIEPGAYYILESKNQVAFDSFIVVDDTLYIFRFSVASNHPIGTEILSFLPQVSLLSRVEWRYVFVVPPRSDTSCHQPRDKLVVTVPKGTRLFSAVLKEPK